MENELSPKREAEVKTGPQTMPESIKESALLLRGLVLGVNGATQNIETSEHVKHDQAEIIVLLYTFKPDPRSRKSRIPSGPRSVAESFSRQNLN